MERSTPIVTAACLLLVVAAVTIPAGVGSSDTTSARPVFDATPPSPTPNTTARLVIPRYRVTQERYEVVRVGMANTLQSGADGARLQQDLTAIERAFESAETVDEKRGEIDRGLIRLENRAQVLEDAERAAIHDYSEGNISAAVLVNRLARIHSQAERIKRGLELLERLSARIDVDVFSSRIRDVDGQVSTLQGPVRERVARVRSGEVPPTRVHVTASDEGVVLAMLSSDRYVREASNWRQRNASAEPELDFGDIGQRVEELYPWVAEQSGSRGTLWRGRGVWRFRSTHPQGTLTAYVDAATEDVFREKQHLKVDEMPTTETIGRNGDDLRVTLRRTYVGGPMEVFVERTATDTTVSATVTVGGLSLGTSGPDGVVRVIEPRPPYAVNATVGNSSIEFTVEGPLDGA